MNVEQICELYLGVSLVTARKKPDHMYKLVNILIEVKGWSVSKAADKLNSRPDTIERYKRKKKECQPLSDEMQKRMFNYLKLN